MKKVENRKYKNKEEGALYEEVMEKDKWHEIYEILKEELKRGNV